ncbi:MAG: hypothetical protein M0P16_00625 [Syntrophales bacterium]|jgi:hypothetical protein|nr:hypothetical protein [Syntrophales bacterium]MCK9390291.1 hypothetical protein [Syntrophales bacterium]
MAKNESDLVVKTLSEAAESQELMKRSLEKSAEQTQKDREEAIANVYEMAGKIKATNFQKSQSAFFGLLMLKQVKESKDYRSKTGMTWEQFCEHVGVDRRRIDEQLLDLKPFRTDFLADFANFSGVTINKIKYLGMAVDEKSAEIAENAIIYNGETIPLDAEHKDEIKALLENLEETHKTEKEEADATIRTKDRLIKAKEDVIKKMDRELNRLQKTVKKTDLTEEEQDAVNLLAQVQSDFIAGLADIKKKIQPGKAPEIALRQMYFLYIFISKIAMEERLKLQEFYRDAEEVPWEITEMELPTAEILIDNAPLTAGKGMGKAYKERVEKRQQAKE